MALLVLGVLVAVSVALLVIPAGTPTIDARRHPTSKQLVWFEHSAHMPNTEEKDKFNEFMIDTVLPVVT